MLARESSELKFHISKHDFNIDIPQGQPCGVLHNYASMFFLVVIRDKIDPYYCTPQATFT
jgi:hypothetical protein